MKCAACKGSVAAKEAVLLNEKPYHVGCFGDGLERALSPVREAIQTLNEFELQIGGDVDAMDAYKLGAKSAPVLSARRRRRGDK